MDNLEVRKEQTGETLIVFLKGKLKATNTDILIKELEDLDGISELIFDMKELDYIASAGFRVVIAAYTRMSENGGTLKVRNVNETTRSTFEYTGLTSILEVTEA